MTAYIVTRSRIPNLRKIIPFWLEQDIPVRLVVEHSEWSEHRNFVRDMGWRREVTVVSPDKVERGIGYARHWSVLDADNHGLKSFIMSDDDMRPQAGSDMRLLMKEAARPGVLGIGAVRRLHDWFSGGAVSANSGVILCPSGWGMQLFALNVRKTLAVGNFDKRLDCFGEDHELMRQGISRKIPWLVHCDVYCDAIGTRYAPGGLNAYAGSTAERKDRELACHRIVHDLWPRYVSEPGRAMRVSWKRMLDDYMPGWQARSAIHGGAWR
jgi:hypothetical protein